MWHSTKSCHCIWQKWTYLSTSVGGSLSIPLLCLQNSSFLSSLVEWQGQVSSYIMAAILSILRKRSESTSRCWKGSSARNASVRVTSLYSYQACQTECLPFPTNAEVISQPISAWNTGRQRALVSQREAHTLLTLIKVKCFPIPKAIQTSASDLCDQSTKHSTKITTSVSTVLTRTLVQPDCRAYITWITILQLTYPLITCALPLWKQWQHASHHAIPVYYLCIVSGYIQALLQRTCCLDNYVLKCLFINMPFEASL